LLYDERPVAMWHVHFDDCNTPEDATGENELEPVRNDSWEAIQHPSLEELERANDFKTPKKVRVLPEYLDCEELYEAVCLGNIDPLD
jgi:hypothetical protein